MCNKPKILFWDIETSPTLTYVFGRWKVNINPAMVIKDSSIICISYKWLGEKEVHTISLKDNMKKFKKDPSDDKELVKKFLKVLDEADIVVAHNGDKFDYKVLKARCIIHGLPSFKARKVDTLKMAKSVSFPRGNRLADLAEVLGVNKKAKSDVQWWIDIMEKSSVPAIDQMIKYCEQDVTVLEDVYNKLLPHVEISLPNMSRLMGIDKDILACPRCGSVSYRKHNKYIKNERVYQRYICKDKKCGATFIGNKPI